MDNLQFSTLIRIRAEKGDPVTNVYSVGQAADFLQGWQSAAAAIASNSV